MAAWVLRNTSNISTWLYRGPDLGPERVEIELINPSVRTENKPIIIHGVIPVARAAFRVDEKLSPDNQNRFGRLLGGCRFRPNPGSYVGGPPRDSEEAAVSQGWPAARQRKASDPEFYQTQVESAPCPPSTIWSAS